MKRLITIITLLICLQAAAPAQRNQYGVKPELVALCDNLSLNKYSPNSLKLAKELLAAGQRLNDPAAQTFAYFNMVSYCYNVHENEKLEQLAQEGMKFAYAHKHLKYYYLMAHNRVRSLSLSGHEIKAFNMSNRYLQQAIADKYAYGQALMLQTFADVKYIHGEFASAIPYFKETLKYKKAHIHEPDMNLEETYMQLARCYLYTYKYAEALPYLSEGLKAATSDIGKFEAHALLAQAEFWLGNREKFMEHYHHMQNTDGDMRARFSRYGTRIQIYYNLLNGNNDEAYRLCMTMDNERVRDAFLSDYYTYTKQYKNAFDKLQKVHGSYSHSNTIAQRKEIVDFITLREKNMLDFEADQLLLQNNDLKLHNANLRFENAAISLAEAKAKEAAEKAKASSVQLMLQKRNAEYKKTKLEADMKHRMEQEQQEQWAFRNRILTACLVCLAPICIFLGIILRNRKRLNIMLKRKQKELTNALEQAEEADRLKAEYINNVGRGLSTQLLTLDSLSHRITRTDGTLTDSEIATLTADIQQCSDTIIKLLAPQG